MKIHREGTYTLVLSSALFLVSLGVIYIYLNSLFPFFAVVLAALMIFLISFFRKPDRSLTDQNDHEVLCPCDGKVVVIEEVFEPEYVKEKMIQVSIFMSPLNVHINWHILSAMVEYYKYHPGKYLVAWHPKSSTENERTTVVYNHKGKKYLVRQIAGALARRIVCYARKGDNATKGQEMGFIKLGSRVDIYFPLGTDIKVKIDDKVSGNRTVLAHIG